MSRHYTFMDIVVHARGDNGNLETMTLGRMAVPCDQTIPLTNVGWDELVDELTRRADILEGDDQGRYMHQVYKRLLEWEASE